MKAISLVRKQQISYHGTTNKKNIKDISALVDAFESCSGDISTRSFRLSDLLNMMTAWACDTSFSIFEFKRMHIRSRNSIINVINYQGAHQSQRNLLGEKGCEIYQISTRIKNSKPYPF